MLEDGNNADNGRLVALREGKLGKLGIWKSGKVSSVLGRVVNESRWET